MTTLNQLHEQSVKLGLNNKELKQFYDLKKKANEQQLYGMITNIRCEIQMRENRQRQSIIKEFK